MRWAMARLGRAGAAIAARRRTHKAQRQRHVEHQRHLADASLPGVIGQCSLRVELKGQHRGRPLFGRGQHHTPRCGAGHKTMTCGMGLHKGQRPGPALRLQAHRQLGIVGAGKGVQLTGTGHHIEHVRKVRQGGDRIGKGLDLLHELGVLDLVERSHPVGQLHTRLHLAVPAARGRRFPFAAALFSTFDEEGFAARTPARR
mgnify:CR=1 FL=1